MVPESQADLCEGVVSAIRVVIDNSTGGTGGNSVNFKIVRQADIVSNLQVLSYFFLQWKDV